MKTVYECRNNEWAQANEPYKYSTHKAHCAVRDQKVVRVFPTKKEAVAFCNQANKTA